MHEQTGEDAQAMLSIDKRKKKMAKKKRKGKLAEEAHAITTKVKKAEARKKKQKLSKKEAEIEKRIRSLRKRRIEDMSERIKKAAEDGGSHVQISALWSDTVEIRLLRAVQEWARKKGFDIDTSYSEIYESPRGSDDLPSDTRGFLTISWE